MDGGGEDLASNGGEDKGQRAEGRISPRCRCKEREVPLAGSSELERTQSREVEEAGSPLPKEESPGGQGFCIYFPTGLEYSGEWQEKDASFQSCCEHVPGLVARWSGADQGFMLSHEPEPGILRDWDRRRGGSLVVSVCT